MNVEWGPVIALGALIGGILAGERAGPSAGVPFLVVAVLAFGSAMTSTTGRRVALAAVAFAALGHAGTTRAINGQAHSPLALAAAQRTPVTLDGVLVDDPSGPRYSASALVRTSRGIVLATGSGDDAMRLRIVEAGDRVRLAGTLSPVRGRERWLHAVARLEGAQILRLRAPSGLFSIADAARNHVLRGTRALPPSTRALVAGFLLGDTRSVPDAVTSAYRDAGLSHLLAVSGENVAFVLAIAGPALRRMRLGARTVTALAVILVFAAMTRFEPSVLRASVMAVLALLSTFAGRPLSRLRVLVYAVIVLLVIDPFLLHSVGFLLSCGAAAGIACATHAIARRLPGPAFVRDPLAVSLGAQVGVTPVLLLAFGQVPVVTPVTNLLAAPAAELIGVYGFLASAVAGFVPPVGPIVHAPTQLLVGSVTLVARVGAAVPMQLTVRGTCGITAITCGAASLACARARSHRGAVPESASG